MNYIYDVLLNFQKCYYDVFDWYKGDRIYHVKKIPIIKINTTKLIDILNYKVNIDKNILDQVFKKTESYSNNSILKYCILVTDGKLAIAISLNKKGDITGCSSLLYEEELDALETSVLLKETDLKYTLIEKINNCFFETRKEVVVKNKLKKEIKKLIKNNSQDILNYIYLECYEEAKDINYIIKNLNKYIDNNFKDKNKKILELVTLVNKQ